MSQVIVTASKAPAGWARSWSYTSPTLKTTRSRAPARRRRSRAFAVGDTGGVNLPRITETRYFVKEHDEIPARMVADNPDVGSFSNCNACHQGAAEGVYDEDRVKIPGFGRWED